jgi:uncharacterized protein DUF4926
MAVLDRTGVQLHSPVELVNEVEDIAAGTHGVVIDAYPTRDVYTVEIVDRDGQLVALLPCRAADLRVLPALTDRG